MLVICTALLASLIADAAACWWFGLGWVATGVLLLALVIVMPLAALAALALADGLAERRKRLRRTDQDVSLSRNGS